MGNKFHFNNLDSIRTIAFFSTFLAHAFYTESTFVEQSSPFQWAVKFREIFSFGVPIFFVLSGFLITYLMLREQELSNKFSLKNFYMRRILRIWPVYFLVLFIGFIIFPVVRSYILAEPYVESASGWRYILFLSNFDQLIKNELPYGIGLGPTWSVSVEEQFYLFWPLTIVFFRQKKIIFPIVISILISVLFSVFFHLQSKNTLYCMIYLSSGAFFAYLSFFHQNFIYKVTRVSPVFFIVTIVLIFFSIYSSFNSHFHFLFIFTIALLIGYAIVYQCFSGRFQLKSIPFIEKLGKYTYGLYLYHVICNFIAYTLVDKVLLMQENNFTVIVLKPTISLTLSLIVSFFSYKYLESYFLRLKELFNTH